MIESLTEQEGETERTQSYVIFQLGGEGYALEVVRVQEVIDLTHLTQVPGGPKWLRGVINLRGHVVPVWDLRIPFDLPVDPKPMRSVCLDGRDSGGERDKGQRPDGRPGVGCV